MKFNDMQTHQQKIIHPTVLYNYKKKIFYLTTFTVQIYVIRAASNNMKLVHWPLIGGLLYCTARRELGGSPPKPLLATST